MTRRILLLLVLTTSVYADVLAPTGMHPVASPLPRPYLTESVFLASDGREYLAAFSDKRFSTSIDYRFGLEDASVWRYDENGQPLDDVALPIFVTSGSDKVSFAPIWNGTYYAVFTGRYRSRVSAGGSAEIQGGTSPDDGEPFSGAWNGSRHAVAYIAGSDLRLKFFDFDLAEVGSMAVNDGVDEPRNAAVASDRNNFLVVWETARADLNRLYGRVIDGAGNPITPQFIIESASPNPLGGWPRLGPTLSWNGSRYLVAWTATTSIEATFIESNGALREHVSIPIAHTAWPQTAVSAWDGIAHLIAWTDLNGTSGVLLSSNGTLLDQFSLAGSTGPAVASNGRTFLLLTHGERALVHSTGSVRVELLGPSSKAYVAQFSPSVTGGASAALVAWYEGDRVYASRIIPDGTTLDGGGIDLGPGDYYGSGNVRTATAGDVHLVGWTENVNARRGRYVRVTAAGDILEGDTINDARQLFTASNGDSFLLAATVNTSSNPNAWLDTIVIVPVSRRGTIQTPVVVATDSYPGIEPHELVWSGHEYVLLWKKSLSPPCSSVFCTPVSQERMTVLDEGGRVIRDVAIPLDGVVLSTAAADGEILVAIAQAGALTVRRLSLDGSVSDPVVISGDASGTRVTLLATDDGFQVWSEAAKRSDAVAPSDFDVRMIPLDSNAKPVGPLRTVAANARFGTVTRAFGASWFTFVIGWRPMPQAHPGFVLRSFFSSLQQRVRIVTRH